MTSSRNPTKAPETGPLRVCGIIGQLTYGGSERHLCDLFLHLDRRRFEPGVICLRPGGPLAPVLRQGGVPCHEIPVLSWPAPLAGVVRELRRFDPHVVCVYTYVDKLWGRLAAALAGVPVILSAYRTVRHPWYERLLLPWTTAVAANSRALLGEFAQTYGFPASRLHLLPNGVDLERFAPAARSDARQALGLPQGAPVAAMVARFNKVKGHEVALEAFARVRAELPEALLLLVGHGPCEQDIRQRAAALDIADSLRFLPSDSDVPQVFAAADVVLLSSHSESLPRVLVEAAACGRPAVATRVGGCAEVVAEGVSGYTVPAGDSEALAKRVCHLLHDPVNAAAMGRQARRLALERHSLPGMARGFEQLCVQLYGEQLEEDHVRGI